MTKEDNMCTRHWVNLITQVLVTANFLGLLTIDTVIVVRGFTVIILMFIAL